MFLRSGKHKVYRGLIAGGIGGLAASWIMPKFQFLLSRALGHSDPHEGQGEDATVRIAQRISSAMLGHQLSAEEEEDGWPSCALRLRNRDRSAIRRSCAKARNRQIGIWRCLR